MGCASAKIFLVVVKFFVFLFLEFVLVVVDLDDTPRSGKIHPERRNHIDVRLPPAH